MLLACLSGIILTLSTIAVFSPTMIGLEMSQAQGDAAAAEMMEDETVPPGETVHADEEDMQENAMKLARRSVKALEESPIMLTDQQQEHSPITRLSCDCPEVLTKGTLASVVGALAFLGFFSTTVLLVVSVWVLRMMAKQKKSETRETKRLTYPPSPPPRPEHLYRRRSSHPYETIPPVHQYHDFEGPTQMLPGAKSSQENEYMVPDQVHRSSEAVYAYMEDMSGTKLTSPSGSPVFHPSSSALRTGSSALRTGSSALRTSSSALRTGSSALQTSSSALQTSSSAFPTGSPGYQSGSPGYQGGSPGYQGGSPGYQGGSPGYQNGSPGYQSGSPGYQGGSPSYQGGSPSLPSGFPVGSPGSPE